jgi:hypothetical protein
MFPHIAELYRGNPTRAVATLMQELPPDDPQYAKVRKRLETLEDGWSLFPKEDELVEIDRFTRADVQDAWKREPSVVTRAEWIFLCYRLFHPGEGQERYNPRLRQEITGILPKLAMGTPENREESLQALRETLSHFDGMALDRLRSVAFVKAHGELLFGYQSSGEGAWDAILDILDAEHQRQVDQWDAFRKEHPEHTVEWWWAQAQELRDYLESL